MRQSRFGGWERDDIGATRDGRRGKRFPRLLEVSHGVLVTLLQYLLAATQFVVAADCRGIGNDSRGRRFCGNEKVKSSDITTADAFATISQLDKGKNSAG